MRRFSRVLKKSNCRGGKQVSVKSSERNGASRGAYFFRTTAWIVSPPLALWESSLEVVSEGNDGVMLISLSKESVLVANSSVGTLDESSVE